MEFDWYYKPSPSNGLTHWALKWEGMLYYLGATWRGVVDLSSNYGTSIDFPDGYVPCPSNYGKELRQQLLGRARKVAANVELARTILSDDADEEIARGI